jgi:hypothetical protein
MDIFSRVIRLKDAPGYLGLDKNKFNSLVRPYITEVRYGTQSVAYDRLDLDNWFEEYKSRNGRPGKALKEEESWGKKSHRDSYGAAQHGTSARSSAEKEFERALERVTLKKPKNS